MMRRRRANPFHVAAERMLLIRQGVRQFMHQRDALLRGVGGGISTNRRFFE